MPSGIDINTTNTMREVIILTILDEFAVGQENVLTCDVVTVRLRLRSKIFGLEPTWAMAVLSVYRNTQGTNCKVATCT